MGLQGAAPAVGDTDAAWSADANAITGSGIMHLANPARGVHIRSRCKRVRIQSATELVHPSRAAAGGG